MNLLLDTQTFLWWYEGSRKLGRAARKAMTSPTRQVRVSTVSVWELAIKQQTGRLEFEDPLHVWVIRTIDAGRFEPLTVTMGHALAVADLPMHHADPFDRLLIAQAQIEGLTIVTSDAQFGAYNVALLDARA